MLYRNSISKGKFLQRLKNKYVLATVILLIQLTFFESVDLITLYKQKRREQQLHAAVQEKQIQVEKIRSQYEALSDPLVREKFAREQYNFKKDNEVIFVLSNE